MKKLSQAENSRHSATCKADCIDSPVKVFSLKDVRATHLHISKEWLARELNMRSFSVDRIEKASLGTRISTLRSYVKALGGELEVIIRIPEHGRFQMQLSEETDETQKPLGRPRANQEKIEGALALVRKGLAVRKAAQESGISEATLYREVALMPDRPRRSR